MRQPGAEVGVESWGWRDGGGEEEVEVERWRWRDGCAEVEVKGVGREVEVEV